MSNLDSGSVDISDSNVDFTQGHDFETVDMYNGNPRLDTADCDIISNFAPNDYTLGTPSVPSVSMSEEETFNSGELVTGDPSVASAAITQGHDFASGAIDAGAPLVPDFFLIQGHVLATANITSAAPTVPTLVYNAALGRVVDESVSSIGTAELETDATNTATLSLTGPNKVDIAA